VPESEIQGNKLNGNYPAKKMISTFIKEASVNLCNYSFLKLLCLHM
jgi:hypothetical protein